MQSRNKSIKEKTAIINKYYKNIYQKNPEIETTLKIHSNLKSRKLSKLKILLTLYIIKLHEIGN